MYAELRQTEKLCIHGDLFFRCSGRSTKARTHSANNSGPQTRGKHRGVTHDACNTYRQYTGSNRIDHLILYAITSRAPKKSIRVESRASSQKSFRKEWRQVLACDLLNDGFYHVARSLRDPTGLLDLLLDKVRFSFRADTLTSGPCTSYNQVPVFVFAAAASTHQAHLLCTSTLGALPRLAICGVS